MHLVRECLGADRRGWGAHAPPNSGVVSQLACTARGSSRLTDPDFTAFAAVNDEFFQAGLVASTYCNSAMTLETGPYGESQYASSRDRESVSMSGISGSASSRALASATTSSTCIRWAYDG